MNWLKENGFGGIMVWSIDMDDFSGKCGNGKYPLLRALNEQLQKYRVNLEYDGPYETHGPRGAYTTKDRKFSQQIAMNSFTVSPRTYCGKNMINGDVMFIYHKQNEYIH